MRSFFVTLSMRVFYPFPFEAVSHQTQTLRNLSRKVDYEC